MHYLKKQLLFVAVSLFLLACTEDEPNPEPGSTFADTIAGRWEAESVLLDAELLQEWSDFELTIEVETDTSGQFYVENIPSYDHLALEEQEKWLNVWRDSKWKLDQYGKWYSLVRDDGVEITVNTVESGLLRLSLSLPGWETECDMSEGGCTLDFKGSWLFSMVKVQTGQ